MYKQDADFSYFIFMPDGKWTYAATLIASDRHHFTVYHVVDGILKEKVHSPVFHVIPTWKVQPPSRSKSSQSGGERESSDSEMEATSDHTAYPRPAPDIKRIRVQNLSDMQAQAGHIQAPPGQQGNPSSAQSASGAPRFGRPPLVQTSLPYAFALPRSVPTPVGTTPSGMMAPPGMLYSPSFAHSGSFYQQPPQHQQQHPQQGYPHDLNLYGQQNPTPLSSPFNQLQMTISPPGLFPGFSYFSSSPRYPGVPPEFQGMFSPMGNQSNVRPPPPNKQ